MANLYLGNLPREITEASLEEFLTEAGCPFEKIKLIRDMTTGEPRGFAFVELKEGSDMNQVIQKLQGCVLNNRPLVANEARPQRPREGGGGGRPHSDHRPRGGGFGGNRGGGGGGRGRGRY
jgi:RNA recognition motif-containing protein